MTAATMTATERAHANGLDADLDAIKARAEKALDSLLSEEERTLRALREKMAGADKRTRIAMISSMSNVDQLALARAWRAWARPEQLPPPADALGNGATWRTWLILAGRGWGKTRTGAEYVRESVIRGRARFIALVGQDAADVRDVMVTGPAGLLTISPPHERPIWVPSNRRLTWPNGAYAVTFSAADYEALRGPQHDLVWCDELCAWPNAGDTWSNLDFGLRLTGPDGTRPHVLVTTTPRPTPTLRKILARPDTVVTRGASFDNRLNLDPSFFASLLAEYKGTRLGRQELYAEVLDDTEGALWTRKMIDEAHEKGIANVTRARRRVVVGVDPSTSGSETAAECGIVVACINDDETFTVLEDATVKGSPKTWAQAAIAAAKRWSADRIIAESNNGGQMVADTLHAVDKNASVKLVTASRGKITRAEPIAALYEQGRVGHQGGFDKLEDQLCTFTGADGERSPDRYDAMVWAITELMNVPGASDIVIDPNTGRAPNPWSM